MTSFWNDKPVGLCDEKKFIPGTIENHKTIDSIQKEQVALPPNCFWNEIENGIREVVTFLNENYVEDGDSKFRLLYSEDFVRWFLPQGKSGWNISISSNGAIIGFVSAVVRKINLLRETIVVAEVNLLCVHKKYRKQNLAPLLISEITRRINLTGTFIAIYTSGSYLPQKPFLTTRYFHKYLNLNKLNDLGFTKFSNLDLAIKLYQHKPLKYNGTGAGTIGANRIKNAKLSEKKDIYILRLCKPDDIEIVEKLFKAERAEVVSEVIDKEKLESMLDDKGNKGPNFQCFVVEKIDLRTRSRNVSGFISTYDLNLLKVDTNDVINSTYLYYSCGDISEAIPMLLTTLQRQGKDVFNSILTKSTLPVIKSHHMIPGSGFLHYYLYNYRLPVISAQQLSYIIF